MHVGVATAPPSSDEELARQRFEALSLQVASEEKQLTYHSSDDEREGEEGYESFDDDDIGDMLDWVETRPGQASSSTSTSSFSHRPNAHGGLLNKAKRANAGGQQAASKLAPTKNNMGRLESKFHGGKVHLNFTDEHVDALSSRNVSQSAVGVSMKKQMQGGSTKRRDRADRATVEQVLDPRTRMVLFKMLNRGVFCEINGCISTGKEANVYHAFVDASERDELAIKVYKTAILVFKDRDRYVTGDSRFSRYSKGNPRQMVKMWAEKEMRNLLRIHAAGIPCPKPVQLRLHILVMEFLGKNGVASPRLKDAGLPPARMRRAYTEVILLLRNMYHRCRLVHADFSEYNLLVHEDEIHVIDVSQSVELDHPRAFDFLREDCKHANDYFRRQGVATLTNKELFDFVVDIGITDDGLDAAMDGLMEKAAARPIVQTVEEEVAEKVWAQQTIPMKAEEIVHYERDHERLAGAGADGVETELELYRRIAGLSVGQGSGERRGEAREGGKGGRGEHGCGLDTSSGSGCGSGSGSESGSSGESESDEDMWEDRTKLTKEQIRELRRANKKEVKEANAEKRKTKIKKHVKKRAQKKGNKKK
jgi:RIO kinase 1